MSDPIRDSAFTQRREALKLPKRRHHLLAAIGVLALLIGGPVLAMTWLGSDKDAISTGQVALPEKPDVPVIAQIDQEDMELPDLLAGTVELGENPTEIDEPKVDALGNLVGGNRTQTLSTPQPPRRATAIPLDARLTRQSQFGPIPGPASDGRTAFQVYSKTAPSTSGRTVSLVVGGLGINRTLTQRAIDELPDAVTLSFAAHAPGLQDWINRARDAGHEVLLELPMEGRTFDPTEPGANRTLKQDGPSEANEQNLHYLLSRAQGYAGVINYRGERFLNRADAAAALLGELDASGLALITDGAFEAPTISALATSLDLPYQHGFGLIDPTADRTVIDQRLDALTDAAAQQSTPIGVGFVYPETIDAVKGWAATLSVDGLTLVPASAALK